MSTPSNPRPGTDSHGADSPYPAHETPRLRVRESTIEQELIEKLGELKYTLRPDIRDRAALERNFREKFEALNRVTLSDAEFQRLLEEIVTADVFAAAHTLRNRNAFTRDDGTPLNYTLVNLNDWCKNTFEVASQLRINTDYSHHRYDVLLLINGAPVVQIELKTLGINPRRAIEQIVEYKNDAGNGYARTLLCFIQLFIVSNRDSTYYFANNNARHFSFNADERFLPIYQYAAPDNSKINGIDAFAETFLAKCTLAQMISRYMVLVASEQKLLMMRPYQIYAVRNIADSRYLDSQDIGGTLPTQYTEALAFIKRNLHRVQGDQGFNTLGQLEIPEIVLEELLVNALVHRDYFTSASIRILIFIDRIEIISPGHLPDSLSVEDIRQGKTNRRNPTLTEHAFKILPYRGLGSGIPRALQEWPQIELRSEVTGNQFSAVIARPFEQTVTVAGQVAGQVMMLLSAIDTRAWSRKALMEKLGLKGRDNFEKLYLAPALTAQWVERTIPDKPNSRLQKYRLTEAGRRRLQDEKSGK